MNVVLNHRLPAIQISETEFKYLTSAELVAIIQDKNLQIEAAIAEQKTLSEKIESLTKENDDLKKLVDTMTLSKPKKGKNDDSNKF